MSNGKCECIPIYQVGCATCGNNPLQCTKCKTGFNMNLLPGVCVC